MSTSDLSPPVQQCSTQTIYRDEWITLRRDDISYAHGHRGTYAVVEKADFALILPYHNDGFFLVEQYRYPLSQKSVEFPQGGFPAGETGTSDELARRELREETGITAQKWTYLGALHRAPALTPQQFSVFLAEELTLDEPERENTEQDMTTRWVSHASLREMIRTGEITDSSSISAYTLFTLYQRGGHDG